MGNIASGKWKELRGQAKEKWGKLTDDDLQQVQGDRKALAGKIQGAYGVTQEEAERQIDEWSSRS